MRVKEEVRHWEGLGIPLLMGRPSSVWQYNRPGNEHNLMGPLAREQAGD